MYSFFIFAFLQLFQMTLGQGKTELLWTWSSNAKQQEVKPFHFYFPAEPSLHQPTKLDSAWLKRGVLGHWQSANSHSSLRRVFTMVARLDIRVPCGAQLRQTTTEITSTGRENGVTARTPCVNWTRERHSKSGKCNWPHLSNNIWAAMMVSGPFWFLLLRTKTWNKSKQGV